MANTEMIREYIRASGYKLQYVARAMQISPNALGQKLQGHTQFKLNEAERLSAVLGLSMYERDLCFFEEQNRREALARRAVKKGGESVTNEQRNKTRLALYRYGMRQRARNPVEHSWCAAIEESPDLLPPARPAARPTCLSCAMSSTAQRTMSWTGCTSGARPIKKPSRTC